MTEKRKRKIMDMGKKNVERKFKQKSRGKP